VRAGSQVDGGQARIDGLGPLRRTLYAEWPIRQREKFPLYRVRNAPKLHCVPDNKNHHYVPRFYLRYFTSQEKCIDLFNVRTKKLIKKAPIKGQCCRDYFYGKNIENEKSLSAVEGQIANTFRAIFERRRLPSSFTAGHLLLCFHIVTQAYRTQYAADTLDELTDGMWKEILKHDPKVPKENLKDVQIKYEDPALVALGHAMRAFPLLMDLEMGVLLAPRGSEFITSDNPIVMSNKFMNWRRLGSNTGIASKGLQILFPICPILTLVMYDKDVYHFGRSKSSAIEVASAQDVHELNVLQMVSASKNVYLFSPAANVFKVAEHAMRFRRTKKGLVQVVAQTEDEKGKSELIQTSHEDIRTDARLDFLRIHSQAKRWLGAFRSEKYQKAVVLRNDHYWERFQAHENAIGAGDAKFEDMVSAIYGKAVQDGTF